MATVVQQLWQRLRDAHDVLLVSGWRNDVSLLPRNARAVKLRPDRPIRSSAALDVAVRRAALSFRPDVVIAQGLEFPTDLAPTLSLLADPFSGGERWGRVRSLRNSAIKTRINAAAVAVVPSESTRVRLIERGIASDQLHVAWPGVDTVQFQPDPSAAVLPAAKDGPIRLLYAARIIQGKGQHVAIEAVKGLPSRLRGRVELDLVGPVLDDDYYASLRRRAVDAPVRFHPQAADLSPWYRRAHIVLFPTTRQEVFGYSAVDGMACGKPVVYSNCGALDEVTGGVGVAVAPGDVGSLVKGLRGLLADPERCAQLGEAGRKLVLERYSWDVAFGRYTELLERAVASRH
jgi:glycosyltransferase involved in cell wall biosynthesis